MTQQQSIPIPMNGRDPANLRGDPITGHRYFSRDFARAEWEMLWTRIWHIAGRLADIPEPGDYLVHDFLKESVIVVRQEDGSLKAFYNACGHRGMKLARESSSTEAFTCPYHGWRWGKDGVLQYAQDPQDFPQGSPCGKLRLKELRCDTWGGFAWYTMDDAAPSLADYLDPIPALYRNYAMETAVRVAWYRIELNANWKFVTDNFSESYHTRTAHPQVPPWIDQDVDSARHEMWPKGHGRTVQPMRPSLTDRPASGTNAVFAAILKAWDIDPDAYASYDDFVMQGWRDLKAAKRRLGRERGYLHYEHLDDEQITDSPHTVIFPNVTISFLPDNLVFFRSEPHPDDPEKCFFDLWCMAFPVEGQAEVESIMAGGETFSLFGQVTFDITPELELAAGGRYTDETKDSFFTQPYNNPALTFIFRDQSDPLGEVTANQSFQDFAPEVTLSWKPTDDLLLFGAYKTGYKSGGFSNGGINSAFSPDPFGDLTFAPETVEGFEAGIKSTLADNQLRLNLTLFTYDYSDLQVDFFNSPIFAFQTLTADARTRGVEVDFEFAPNGIDGLNLRGAINYTDAEYTDFPGAPCFAGQTIAEGCTLIGGISARQNLTGAPLSVAPEWTGTLGAAYTTAVGNDLEFGFNIDARYSDDYLASGFGNPLSAQDSYVTLDAGVRFGAADSNWQIAVIGKNLTNEFFVTGAVDGPSTGSGTGTANGVRADQLGFANLPRTVQVEVTKRF